MSIQKMLVALLLCIHSFVLPLSAQPVEFANTAEILISDFGPGSIYPSTIQVSGLPQYLDSLEN